MAFRNKRLQRWWHGLIIVGLIGLGVRHPSEWNIGNLPVAAASADGVLDKTIYLPLIMRNFPPVNIFGAELGAVTDGNGLQQMAQTQMGWVRRAALEWRDVQPTNSAPQWSVLSANGLEQEMLNASAHGMRLILVVRGTPAWAQAHAGYSCGAIKTTELGAFGNFMRQLVTRYSVAPYNVKYWEIWNEPDVAWQISAPDSPYGCWGDESDPYYGGGAYGEMLKAIYPQVKAADPMAQVLVGGLLLDCDPRLVGACANNLPAKFLEGILGNGGGPYFNGVSFHAYDYYGDELGRYGNTNTWHASSATTGPVSIAKADFLRSVLTAHNVPSKYLMDTESALLCDTCAVDPVFATTKAYYVTEVYAASIALGLRANMWYTPLGWRNSNLLDPITLAPTAAYTAYQVSANKLIGVDYVGTVNEYNGIMGYKFEHGDRMNWVLWAYSAANLGDPIPQNPITLPVMPTAIYDALGTPISPTTSLTVSVAPLYIEWTH